MLNLVYLFVLYLLSAAQTSSLTFHFQERLLLMKGSKKVMEKEKEENMHNI